MINLLPPEAHSGIKREYWIRVLSVWALLLAGAFFVTALLLAPSYVLVSSELKALKSNTAATNDSEEAYRAAEEKVLAANALVGQLDIPQPKVAISEILDTIERTQSPGITLRTYSIRREGRSINEFHLQGVADSREALANFKAELEREALFESADIPISDLARDENLPFVVTLTISALRQDP